jgi:hypothetical protein
MRHFITLAKGVLASADESEWQELLKKKSWVAEVKHKLSSRVIEAA